VPELYDISGRKVFRPDSRRHSGFRPTFPIGRFLTQPLKHSCPDLLELRNFLTHCKYISDEEQFGERDYWQAPEQFEESKKGDCEDFALWAWRQLLQMGYEARFVVGRASRYGDGHAWVTFQKDNKFFLLESLNSGLGLWLPRLSVIRYTPKFSVTWDGDKISYFEHQDKKFNLSPQRTAVLIGEWLLFWLGFWVKVPFRIGTRLAASAIG
jgi:hypothetical protein